MSSQIDPAARVAMLVPQSTRDNYIGVVRRAAVAHNTTAKAAATEQVKNWRAQHEADPLGGWDVLADWLEKADLDASVDVNPADAAKVRAFESAKRDPANPQAAMLDLSDDKVRDEIDAARQAVAERASADAPVVTDAGVEVPAGRVDAILNGDVPKPSATPAKK